MGDVIPLVQPLDEQRLIDALREITDDTTEAVVILTLSPSRIGVRAFGPDSLCRDAISAVAADYNEDT